MRSRATILSLVVGAMSLFAGTNNTAVAGALYAVSGASNTPSTLYQLDPSTGAVINTIGATGFSHVTALAFDPTTGALHGHVSDAFGSGATQLIQINVTTGAGTLVGPTGQQVPDMSFDASGQLYAWSEFDTVSFTSDNLYRIDKATGASTLVGPSGIGTSNTGMAFAPDGTLWLKSFSSLYTLDKITGAASFVIGLDQGLQNALAFDESGKMFSVRRGGGTSFLHTIDPTTGVTTQVGNIGVSGISALAFQPVPEPSTWLAASMAGCALLGLARRGRRIG